MQMKKFSFLIIALLIGWCCPASAQSKLDLPLLRMLQKEQAKAPDPDGWHDTAGCTVLAILTEGATLPEDELQEMGVKVGTTVGRVAVLRMPVDRLEEVAALPQIESLSANQRHTVECLNTRIETGASTLHDAALARAEGLSQGYTGRGVVVGIVDTGIEYNHLNFLNPETGATRLRGAILYRPEEGAIDSIREVYTEPCQLDTLTTDDVLNDHGTQTAGVAAGSYAAPLAPPQEGMSSLQGMAPEADLVLCGTSVLEDDRLIDGLVQIFARADELGEPCVVNLSIGNPIGWKDGKSAFCLACEALTEGGDAPGRAIVLSAGNDGAKNYTAHCALQDTLTRCLLLEPVVKNGQSTYYNPNLDVYCSDSLPLGIDYALYDTLLGEWQELPFEQHRWDTLEAGHDGRRHIIIDCDTCQMSAWPHCLLAARMKSPYSETAREVTLYYINNESVGYDILPGPGEGDCWIEGSPDLSISDMCCTDAVLSVGAYSACDSLINVFGRTQYPWCPRGEVCDFSSYGPTAQGTMKPDAIAPGASVVTSLSSFHEDRITYYYTSGRYLNSPMMYVVTPEGSTRSYYWLQNVGTSLSSPAVAGIIALWMEACPTLTVRQIRDVMRSTCRWDDYCAEAPRGTVQAGFGKVDAMAGMRAVLSLASLSEPIIDPTTSRPHNLSTSQPHTFDLLGRPHSGTSLFIHSER